MNDQDVLQVFFDIGARCDYIADSSLSKTYAHIGGSACWLAVREVMGALVLSVYTADTYATWDVGACDYFGSNLSDIRYALTGCGCAWWEDCGAAYLSVNDPLGYRHWDDGACDYLSLNSGSMKYLWGVGGCFDEVSGVGMYTRNDFVANDRAYWLGACFIRS